MPDGQIIGPKTRLRSYWGCYQRRRDRNPLQLMLWRHKLKRTHHHRPPPSRSRSRFTRSRSKTATFFGAAAWRFGIRSFSNVSSIRALNICLMSMLCFGGSMAGLPVGMVQALTSLWNIRGCGFYGSLDPSSFIAMAVILSA